MNIDTIPISVSTSAPGGATNAYFLAGNETFLVDPAEQTEAVTSVIDDNSIDHILVTHTHPDHVGGVANYREKTDACLWAHASFTDRFVDATGVNPDATYREGTNIGGVTVMHTPGHAPDHVVFATDEIAITGDMAFRDGSVFVGGRGADMRAYFTSLRRLLVQNYRVLYPGHGPVIHDPQRSLTRLLNHRADREHRVLRAVRDGASSVEEIVTRAYDKDVSDVQTLAELSVHAHLDKLHVENKVEWNGETARALGE